MKIVLTVPLEEQVPPKKYGGTELVVYLLGEELVRRGHETYLLGTGNSSTSATLIPLIEKPIRSMYNMEEIDTWRDYWKMASAAHMIEHINRIQPDIVHNHYAWRLILFENVIDVPMMSTIHGPLTSVKERQTYGDHPGHSYISISDNQREAMPQLNWVRTVYNGIDVDSFRVNTGEKKREHFLFLGRISPEKGVAEIVKMISQTKHSLVLAAKLDTVDKEYYETKVKPYIDGKQIRYVGEVGHEEKEKLLQTAKALLLWLNWEEPFGLVVPEANACGTPVIVNRRGSMRELVVDGKTGYLVNSIEEMKEKLNAVDSIQATNCRKRVEKHFSAASMTDGYLKAAEQAIKEARK